MAPPEIYISLVGVGLVGSQVLSFLLTPRLSTTFRLLTLTNSKKTILLRQEIPSSTTSDELLTALSDPQSSLVEDTFAPSIETLQEKLVMLLKKGRKTIIVVDVTANDSVGRSYTSFLSKGIDVVTANKIGYSSSYDLWKQIQATQLKTDCGIAGFEATVAAGLPIIQTLRELVLSGDEVVKVEGVLSGTLSYIFSNFSSVSDSSEHQEKFSEIVRVAKEKGYTEPNPLSDLTGSDVARKLCILTRLMSSSSSGLPELTEGYASVPTESLVTSLHHLTSADEFMSSLPSVDAELEELRTNAAKVNKRLRYTGVIDVLSGKVKCGVEAYDVSHPFVSGLKGAENMVVFQTKRYKEGAELVIKGPGAGAEVTAMGVCNDLVRIWERRGGRGGI